MRKTNTQHIGDIMSDLFKDKKLDQKLKEARLIKNWESIVGKTIAKRTQSLAIKNGVLFVSLSSSVVRNELQMAKKQLIKIVNEKLGETLIRDVVLR